MKNSTAKINAPLKRIWSRQMWFKDCFVSRVPNDPVAKADMPLRGMERNGEGVEDVQLLSSQILKSICCVWNIQVGFKANQNFRAIGRFLKT